MVPLGAPAPAVLPFVFPGLPGVACAFTTRTGGGGLPPYHSANISFDVGDDPAVVAANRRALAASLGLSAWCECRQVHGDVLHIEPEPVLPDAAATLPGDALATSRPGLALCVKTADCQPVLLAHQSGRFVAALHVGWRGNVLDLPGTAVARLCAHYGCHPAELLAVRGPSLGPAAAEFTNFAAEFGPGFADVYDERRRTVDLWRLTRRQLESAGLVPGRIFGVDRCTLSEPEAFFSFRAARVTGRQAALIWMRP